MQPTTYHGVALGLGAAINVELGFVPDWVEVFNATDGTLETIWFRGRVMTFTSAGTIVPQVGDTIKGVTSKATARISKILLASGSYAGGDAAGVFLFNEDAKTGTFQIENIINVTQNAINGTVGTDDATIAVDIEQSVKIDTAAAPVTGNNALSSYVGDSTHAAGFTIGSSVATSGKVLRWRATRNDDGVSYSG